MSRDHALYRFYDSNDMLMYIGISVAPWQRWKAHTCTKQWWLDVEKITLEHLPTRGAALRAERAAILEEKPKYNLAHSTECEREDLPSLAGVETNGCCALCSRPLPSYSGRGRPREFCSSPCADAASAIRRLVLVIPHVQSSQALRSYLVAEILNRLPVDREVLAERARGQARDNGGRFS